MAAAILITQCLQNDFVKPLGRFEPVPNVLHIGFEEARRLMGDDPQEGPVAVMMRWAYQQPAGLLRILHIRDWHDPDDSFQIEHFRQFGPHCLGGSGGAEFAFPIPDHERPVIIIDSPGLNDFIGTPLGDHLSPFARQPVKVGLVGVWTEAKISFLAYDLRTRYPTMQLAVCSALTASSSRTHHFLALEQLQRLLGVRVFSSIGDFTDFLCGTSVERPLPLPAHADWPVMQCEGVEDISETDTTLIRYLFRDSRRVRLRALDGGFSGNLVLGCESVDVNGHQQVPHVVKIGPQAAIGQERTAFEQIENVLGNNAPRITAFADSGGRGALKYRYAAMGGGFSSTFQKLYCDGLSRESTEAYLTDVFEEQLGRFYRAAEREQVNLLEYYWFKPDWAAGVKERIEELLGTAIGVAPITLPTGRECPNPYRFYRDDLHEVFARAKGSTFFSYVHGDLNGANIIIDAHENVWLIDFFHTHRGHVLKDLIKLENDLLYIFTPITSAADLAQAMDLTDLLLQVADLRRPLPETPSRPITHPELRRAYDTIRFLRSFYPPLVKEDRSPLQLLIGQLRYAVHTLWFDESNHWQKLWALYTAGWCCRHITKRLGEYGPLRIDWLDSHYTKPGKLGLTILPGRRDTGRDLHDDIAAIAAAGVTHVVPLITDEEFAEYGVDGLLNAYRQAGLAMHRLPMLDQGVCSLREMRAMTGWLHARCDEGANVVVHCVGGLGRSGVVAACFLVSRNLDADTAIDEVRRTRSPRAVETAAQEAFVRDFARL